MNNFAIYYYVSRPRNGLWKGNNLTGLANAGKGIKTLTAIPAEKI